MANIAIAPDVEPRREEFTLTAPDGCTFPALRYRPAAHVPVRAALVLLHGFIEHHLRYDHVLRFFASQGIDALAFSQRGFGARTKGEYGDTSWKEQYEDVEEVLVEMRKTLDAQYEGRLPMYLYGHSMVSTRVRQDWRKRWARQRRDELLSGEQCCGCAEPAAQRAGAAESETVVGRE